MTFETVESPEAMGLDARRWRATLDLAHRWCERGEIPAAALFVARSGMTTGTHRFGRHRLEAGSPPLRRDAIFLVASITKPLVATAILLLMEEGRFTLDDRVADFIDGFGRNDKADVTIRHLLTHTSGLPVSLRNHAELRSNQAPLSAYVDHACMASLSFAPGHGVQYSDVGYCVLGELITRLTGQACGRFLRTALFEPLEMADTILGVPDRWFTGPDPDVARVAEARVPEDHRTAIDWNWNSRYQRQLGAPWGGLLSTPVDLARFAQMWLRQGKTGAGRLLTAASVEAATRNQLADMPDVPRDERRKRPRGLSWWLRWPGDSRVFGDLMGPRAYGHWGTSGAVLWIDPDRDALAVFLTTQSQGMDGPYLPRMCNAIAACLL